MGSRNQTNFLKDVPVEEEVVIKGMIVFFFLSGSKLKNLEIEEMKNLIEEMGICYGWQKYSSPDSLMEWVANVWLHGFHR